MVYCSNRGEGGVQVLQPGIYGLSNKLLDSPWAKVVEGKRRLEEIMEDEPDSDTLTDKLMTLLSDRTWSVPTVYVYSTLHQLIDSISQSFKAETLYHFYFISVPLATILIPMLQTPNIPLTGWKGSVVSMSQYRESNMAHGKHDMYIYIKKC